MSEGLARKLDGMSIRMRIGATLEKREFEYSNVGRSHEEAAGIEQADFDSYQASCGFGLLSGSAKEVDSFCASFLKLPLTPPAGESLAGQQSKRQLFTFEDYEIDKPVESLSQFNRLHPVANPGQDS